MGTAVKVARDVGIVSTEEYENFKTGSSEHKVAMDAAEFRDLVGDVIKTEDAVEIGKEQTYTYSLNEHNQEAFNDIVDSLKVIGRAVPEDKLRLVVALKNAPDHSTGRERRVGIVGEGINDVEAFDAADVSFAC